MAPLTGAAKEEVKASWRRPSGRVLPERLAAIMTTFMVERGQGAAEARWKLPAGDAAQADWTTEWEGYVSDAGITSAGDSATIINYIKLINKVASADGELPSSVSAVTAVFVKNGVTVSDSVKAQLVAALAEAEKGAKVEQLHNMEGVYIIYLAHLPGGDSRTWYVDMQSGINWAPMEGDNGALPQTIPMRHDPGYVKAHKSTTMPSLERVLLKKGEGGQLARIQYFSRVSSMLLAQGLDYMALRLGQILSYVQATYLHEPEKQRMYLEYYFFDVFEGLGVPAIHSSVISARIAQARPAGDAAAAVLDMQPTVPAPVESALGAMMQALMAMQSQASSSQGVTAEQLRQQGAIQLADECAWCGKHHPTADCTKMKDGKKKLERVERDAEAAAKRRAAEAEKAKA